MTQSAKVGLYVASLPCAAASAMASIDAPMSRSGSPATGGSSSRESSRRRSNAAMSGSSLDAQPDKRTNATKTRCILPPSVRHIPCNRPASCVRASRMTWWLNRTGQPEGPYEEAQIVHMIQSGQLRAGNVCPQGSQAWTPLEAHPGFGAALRAAAGPVAGGVPAQRKGKGMRVALIVVGVVVLLGALGLGGLYLSQRGGDEEEYKDGIDKKEAEKRVKAFEKSYAVMKKIDPASVPAIETDGFTVS